MKLKKRLKAALKAFINPAIIEAAKRKEKVFKIEQQQINIVDSQLLEKKNVLITGAGRNIGKSIALEMARQGANIFFTDLDPQRCLDVEKELTQYPIIAQGIVSDISKIEDINNLYEILVKQEIKIDILVNNVGLRVASRELKNIQVEDWYLMFNTNVIGPMYLTKLITEMMTSHSIQGSIIFITSIHQEIIGRFVNYSSSKAALGMIIKELAIELAPKGIRVNGIAPGWVIEDEQGKPLFNDNSPLHKMTINPCYIGRASVYLASDYFSKFTTGIVLKIDAGLSL